MHVLDASKAVGVASKLTSNTQSESYRDELSKTGVDEAPPRLHQKKESECRLKKAPEQELTKIDFEKEPPPEPRKPGTHVFKACLWRPFGHLLRLEPLLLNLRFTVNTPQSVPRTRRKCSLSVPRCPANSGANRKKAWLLPSAVCGIWPARRISDDVRVQVDRCCQVLRERFHFLRQQAPKSSGRASICLSDFLRDLRRSHWCFRGPGRAWRSRAGGHTKEGDDYNAILLESLADRLAEACAEWLHHQVRTNLWGYSPGRLNREQIIQESTGHSPRPWLSSLSRSQRRRLCFDT